jgi:hypothetical protein
MVKPFEPGGQAASLKLKDAMQNALFISYMTWKPDEHETADCARPAKVGILREIVMTMIHTSRILSSSRFFTHRP